MSTSLALPYWLVNRMGERERKDAEEMTLREEMLNDSVRGQESKGTVQWIDHGTFWEVRAD